MKMNNKGMSGGDIDKARLQAAGTVDAKMKDFDFDLSFKVTSFSVSAQVGAYFLSENVKSNRISQQVKQKEYLKIEAAPLRRYFPPGTTAKQMQTTMLRAMEFYRQHTQNRADKPKEREER